MGDGNSPTREELFPGLAASLASIAHLKTKGRQVKFYMSLHSIFPIISNTVNFIMHTVLRYGINSNNLSCSSCPLVIQKELNKTTTERRMC